MRVRGPPSDDAAVKNNMLGLIDGEPVVLSRIQARNGADGAVDVDDPAARAADQVVVVTGAQAGAIERLALGALERIGVTGRGGLT